MFCPINRYGVIDGEQHEQHENRQDSKGIPKMDAMPADISTPRISMTYHSG